MVAVQYLIILASILATTGVLFALSSRDEKSFLKGVFGNRKKIRRVSIWSALSAVVSGILSSVVAGLIFDSILSITTIAVAVVTLVFITVLSAYTDFQYRQVDRQLLRVAIFINFWLGLANVIVAGNEPAIAMLLVCFVMSATLLLVPTLGASDVRAIALLLIVSISTLPIDAVLFTLAAALIGGTLFGVGQAVVRKTTKVSIPLVPFIAAPYPIILFIHLFTIMVQTL